MAMLGQPQSYFPLDSQSDPEYLRRLGAIAAPAGLGAVTTPASTPPAAAAPTPKPSIGQRIQAGLGALFPIDPNSGIDPAYAKQLQNNAILKLGLGMVAAGRQPGASFGGALATGLGQASADINGAMQTAYQNARAARADRRADDREDREMAREDRLDRRQEYLQDHQLEREKVADQRYKEEQQFRQEQADQAQKRFEAEQNLRERAFNQRGLGQQAPMGYRYNAQGNLEFIPGGPADPNVAASTRTLRPIPAAAAQGIIQNRASIKQIDRALESVNENPDAFGMQNYLPDMATQRMPGKGYKGGVDARAQIADIGSLKIHDRSGAAVTAQEFPRLRPFIPAATDDPQVVKQKLENLKANLQLMQDEIEGFYTPDMGYRPLSPSSNQAPPQMPSAPPTMGPPGLGRPPAANVEQRAASYY